jgi:2-haloalkanoic acid dehalogenase type II
VTSTQAPFRAVVFDLFDTLVDLELERIPPLEHRGKRIAGTVPDLYEAFSRQVADVDFDSFAVTLREVDAGFRETRYARGLELPTEERFAALLERFDVADDVLVETLTQTHMGRLREQVRTIEHHPEVLASLRAQVPLALCSNFSHSQTAMRVLLDAGLHEHLDVLVVSDVAGIRKPRPEIFEDVLEQLGTAPGETLHVGDNLSADVAGAKAVGMHTAWVTRRVADPEAKLEGYDGPAPDHRISDLAELLPLLGG